MQQTKVEEAIRDEPPPLPMSQVGGSDSQLDGVWMRPRHRGNAWLIRPISLPRRMPPEGHTFEQINAGIARIGPGMKTTAGGPINGVSVGSVFFSGTGVGVAGQPSRSWARKSGSFSLLPCGVMVYPCPLPAIHFWSVERGEQSAGY